MQENHQTKQSEDEDRSQLNEDIVCGKARFKINKSPKQEPKLHTALQEPVPKLNSSEIREQLRAYPLNHSELCEYLLKNARFEKKLDKKTLAKLLSNDTGLLAILKET